MSIYRLDKNAPAAKRVLRSKILTPSPLKEIRELDALIQSRPCFTGPGLWLKVIREEERKKG